MSQLMSRPAFPDSYVKTGLNFQSDLWTSSTPVSRSVTPNKLALGVPAQVSSWRIIAPTAFLSASALMSGFNVVAPLAGRDPVQGGIFKIHVLKSGNQVVRATLSVENICTGGKILVAVNTTSSVPQPTRQGIDVPMLIPIASLLF